MSELKELKKKTSYYLDWVNVSNAVKAIEEGKQEHQKIKEFIEKHNIEDAFTEWSQIDNTANFDDAGDLYESAEGDALYNFAKHCILLEPYDRVVSYGL